MTVTDKPSTTLAQSLLDRLESAYAERLASAIETVAADQEVAARRSTVAERKRAWAKAIAELDAEKLFALEATMSVYVTNLVTVPEPRPFEGEEPLHLMQEHDRMRDITEFLGVRRDFMKAMVFAHLDAEVGPDTNGEVKVPELRRKFRREGAGQADPDLDVDKLLELLGPEAHKVVDVVEVPTQVIPAHTETVFSEDKLVELIQADPAKMELLREAIVPGRQRTPRFVVRNYGPDDD